jgi:uncharacterized membrane protein required for colicin V production
MASWAGGYSMEATNFLGNVAESWFWKYFFSNLGWVDWVLIAFCVVGIFLGLKNGLSKELPRLLESLLVLLVAFEYYPYLSEWLTRETPLAETYARALTFGLIWFVCWLSLRMIFEIAGKLVHLEVSAPFEAIGGVLVGGSRYVLFFSLLSYFLMLFPLDWIHQSYQVNSWSGQKLTEIPPQIHLWTRNFVRGVGAATGGV